MRTILLSVRPEVFENIRSAKKIYEHRKVFPDEPITAFLYVGRPQQEIAGLMILKNRHSLSEWKEKFAHDTEALNRIDEYMNHYRYVMEIHEFQEIKHISLEIIKKQFPDFLIPQMYYYLDNTELLTFLTANIKPISKKIQNDFSKIDSTQICVF